MRRMLLETKKASISVHVRWTKMRTPPTLNPMTTMTSISIMKVIGPPIMKVSIAEVTRSAAATTHL